MLTLGAYCGILSKRFPQLAAVCLGAVNVAHIVCTAVIHGIAIVKGGIQCRGAVIPVFQYGGGLSGVLVQLVQHTGIRNQIALEQEKMCIRDRTGLVRHGACRRRRKGAV